MTFYLSTELFNISLDVKQDNGTGRYYVETQRGQIITNENFDALLDLYTYLKEFADNHKMDLGFTADLIHVVNEYNCDRKPAEPEQMSLMDLLNKFNLYTLVHIKLNGKNVFEGYVYKLKEYEKIGTVRLTYKVKYAELRSSENEPYLHITVTD